MFYVTQTLIKKHDLSILYRRRRLEANHKFLDAVECAYIIRVLNQILFMAQEVLYDRLHKYDLLSSY